jgi:hypothetical protein
MKTLFSKEESSPRSGSRNRNAKEKKAAYTY